MRGVAPNFGRRRRGLPPVDAALGPVSPACIQCWCLVGLRPRRRPRGAQPAAARDLSMASRSSGPNGRSDLMPGRIALGYGVFSLIWIFGSGYVVAALTRGASSTALEIGKGAGFVGVTALALYVVLARRARAIRSAEAARVAADEERLRLATAVEQAAEAIIITDPEACILYVNPALERLSGYAKAELVGRKPSFLHSSMESRGVDAVMWPSLTGSENWHGTLLNVRKDGVVYEVETVISPIHDPAGNVVSYVAVQHDVSHERALERELAEAGRMEAVGQLAGGIAHDFNNLLTAISGYAELLGEDMPPEWSLGKDMPVHVHLLAENGIHIIECLNLEELAADGVTEFLFVGVPMKIRGATGAPVRPLAMV